MKTVYNLEIPLLFCLPATVYMAPSAHASGAVEYAMYGDQRQLSKPLEVGDPISAGSGAFFWSKQLFNLGGPKDLSFAIHYRTDPSLYQLRNPYDFPPGEAPGSDFLNAWRWQPSPLLVMSMGRMNRAG